MEPMESIELPQVHGALPELYELPLAASRFGLPADYERAHEVFAEAQEAWDAGRFSDAATQFLAVSALVKEPSPRTTYASQFAQMRLAAYKDAALAFKQAGAREAGRTALAQAREADAENRAGLDALLASLA